MPTFTHAKNTVIKVGGVDISAHCNTSTFTTKGSVEDLSTYGTSSVIKGGKLSDGSFSLGGFYSPGVTGTPHAVFYGKTNTELTLIRQPEGTGNGKPQETFSAVLTSYVEVNAVADYVSWTADLEISGDITETTQS